jgi:hypothetical protein
MTGGGRPSVAKPERPGAKWYARLRSKATSPLQRRRISRMIAKYDKALRSWQLGTRIPDELLEQEKRVAREIQSFHQRVRGWIDIGYHALIFASGTVMLGRPSNALGAHAYGANNTMGVCFVMGPGDEPTAAMLDAFNELRERYGLREVRGHRQRPGNSTECPGDALMRALRL